MTRTARTAAAAAPALSPTKPAPDKIAPREFVNLGALLATCPNLQGNPQTRTHGAAYDAGRDMVASIHASYSVFDATPIPPDRYMRENMARGVSILLDRVIGGMAGNYGYALAYADAAAGRLAAHMDTEEKDRDGVAGFASKSQQLLEAAMERDAEAAWICWLIQGATEAFEELTGNSYKLYQPVDKGRNIIRTEAEVAKVATNVNDFLARRRG